MTAPLLHHDKAIYSPLSFAQIILIFYLMLPISLPPERGYHASFGGEDSVVDAVALDGGALLLLGVRLFRDNFCLFRHRDVPVDNSLLFHDLGQIECVVHGLEDADGVCGAGKRIARGIAHEQMQRHAHDEAYDGSGGRGYPAPIGAFLLQRVLRDM